jgi:hypothetical protein
VTDACLVDDIEDDGELTSQLAVVHHHHATDLNIHVCLHLEDGRTITMASERQDRTAQRPIERAHHRDACAHTT